MGRRAADRAALLLCEELSAAANVGVGAAQLPARLLLREGQHGLEAVLAGGDDVAAYQTVAAEEQVGLHASGTSG